MHELRKAGLPTGTSSRVGIAIWKYRLSGWLVADASYIREVGSDLDLCQVIVRIDEDSHVVVVRKCPFKRTDVDKPDVTEFTVRDGECETLFSGLGYYL